MVLFNFGLLFLWPNRMLIVRHIGMLVFILKNKISNHESIG